MTGTLRVIDLIIVILYLVGIAGAGFFFVRRNRSSDVYFKGGGQMPWWAVSLSLFAALFSPLSFLAVPALVYVTDMSYLPIFFGGVLIVLPLTIRWYIPFFRRLDVTSAYEYLEKRFNPLCRAFASAAFILFMITLTAIVAYLPAVALSAVTGMDVNMAIATVILCAVVYGAIGGISAIVWIDFVQAILLLGAMAAVVVFLLMGIDGGLQGCIAKGMDAGKFRAFDLTLDWSRPTFWVVFIGGTVANFAAYTSDQRVVQRYLTVSDVNAAAKSMWMQAVTSVVTSSLLFFVGVALWVYYKGQPDGLPVLSKNDQILPVFIANGLPPGVAGLALAAIAAATISTLAANMNSTAAAFTTDFYERFFRGGDKLRCGRVCSVLVGVLGGVFAIVLANTELASAYEHFQRYTGILTGGLACLFLMGLFMPRVNGFGAVCGLVANYVVTFGLDLAPWSGKPHLLLYGFCGMVVCLIVASVASWPERRAVSEFFPKQNTTRKDKTK